MIKQYENLANAIIELAAKDYIKALKKHKNHQYKKEYLYEMRSIENFFRSQWYQSLTNVDGNMLIKKLKAEVM